MNRRVTFLGPKGATFSDVAYHRLAVEYGAPIGEDADYQTVATNHQVIDAIVQHGGFGAIAMETAAQGRVAEPLEAFIGLLGNYDNSTRPFSVIRALKMKLSFCLMARAGVALSQVTGVVAHPKALGACKDNVSRLSIPTREATSNGEAARMVAQDSGFGTWAALGPVSAAEKFGLNVVADAYEDATAVTTFFLLGPNACGRVIGEKNRALIVFQTADAPGALVRALEPWEKRGLNLMQIHSVHVNKGTYDFAIEVEVEQNRISSFNEALREFERAVVKHITFGPFQVL